MSMRLAHGVGQRLYSKRRTFLLASAVGLCGGVMFFNFAQSPTRSGADLFAPPYAHAEMAPNAQRPVGFADVVEMVKPAVMSVKVKMDAGRELSQSEDNPLRGTPFEDFFKRFRQPDGPRFGNRGERYFGDGDRGRRHQYTTGQGSGFFISADGYAVTNNHVVDKAEHVDVTTDDGSSYTAKVIGTDERTDLALIKIDGRNDFPFVRLAEKMPRIGDWVFAVGNPFGLGGTVTAGIVSARGRDVEKDSDTYEDLIQIDAPINKGNSGGPTFDLAGDVVGVNTVILSPTGGSIGIAFAIPADKAKEVTDQLKHTGAVARGWLGIQFQSVLPEIADSLDLPEAAGILIADVQPSGPAAKAGITAGDLIDSVNGTMIKNAHDFSRAIDAVPPHAVVILGVRKKGRQAWIAVTTGLAPAPHDTPAPTARNDDSADHSSSAGDPAQPGQPLGLKLVALSAIDGSEGRHGVMVVEVEPGGLAAGRGIDAGDLILDVADEAIGAPEDLYRLVDSAKSAGKRSILLRIKSGETAKFVALPIG
jgi:serine protease Do